MSDEYDNGELSQDAIKALKETIDQYAMVEVVIGDLMAEVAKLPAMTDNTAREIQYAFGENRAARYGDCDQELGYALSSLGGASATIKRAHEAAIAMLLEATDKGVSLRRPRTKALHRFADALKAKWPKAKFGR